MGWTRRRTRLEADLTLPMFDIGQAPKFVALAQRVFAENGLETTYDGGCLRGSDGQLFGLTNVGHLAATVRERQWRRVLEGHVLGLLAANATPKERDFDKVRDRVFLRLWAAEDLSFGPDCHLGFGEGLAGLVSIDHPKYVETLTRTDDVETLGGWDLVSRTAVRNLARLTATRSWQEGTHGQVLASIGGFFNASRVLSLPHLLKQDFLVEPPSDGVLFAVPNRHLVLLHPLDAPGRDEATRVIAEIAHHEYDMAGGISPDLWCWDNGVVTRVDR
jgi:hypothetical protein